MLSDGHEYEKPHGLVDMGQVGMGWGHIILTHA
jgi:hypothetical protein